MPARDRHTQATAASLHSDDHCKMGGSLSWFNFRELGGLLSAATENERLLKELGMLSAENKGFKLGFLGIKKGPNHFDLRRFLVCRGGKKVFFKGKVFSI